MVLRNDERLWAEVRSWLAAGRFDNVVISPGPGTPLNDADVGACPAPAPRDYLWR